MSSDLNATVDVEVKKEKIITALCPDCKKTFQKTRALKSFGKCSQMKDFVRRYESVQQLAGMLLLKQQQQVNQELAEDERIQLEKANKILNNPEAKKRYNQVLERRNKTASKKKSTEDDEAKKHKKRSLEERASLDAEFVVPPASKDFDMEGEAEAESEDTGEESKSQLEL